MTKLTLTSHVQTNTTVLENEFIDKHMANANGEYVKVYLFLLRHLNDPSGVPKISEIADALDDTEKDVIRALNYWKNQGLLDYEVRPDAVGVVPQTTGAVPQTAGAVSQAAVCASDVSDIGQFRSRKEFKEILHVTEQYLQKTLSHTEMEAITYFYETLGMSADLIEYLIEYCVENNHKSIHYIKKVALSWYGQKITTVAEAKQNTVLYNKDYYAVLNAYGIKGRAPAASETVFIRRWYEEYGFSSDIVLEAVNRTMNTIHQPSFDYTESILKDWFQKDVRKLGDIAVIDAAYLSQKEQKAKARAEARQKKTSAGTAPNNKFNNFDSRTYDMEDLERKLLQQ